MATAPASLAALWREAIPATIPRAALVTGASKRIGHAIALALADAGFAVAIHYRSSAEAAGQTAAAVRARGATAALIRADLAHEAEVADLLDQLPAGFGPLGVLVNNAGHFARDEWSDATRATWDAHLEPNLRAPFVLSQQFAARLPQEAEGAVVNLLDQRVWSLTPHFVSYTVSKAAMWALTQTLALALAPRVRVNGIGPGPTLPSARQSAEQFARQSASVPLGHGATPDEIGRAVLAILALPAMTGQMIALDGGQHLQWSPPRGGPALPE